MRYIQHQLLALSFLLDTYPQPLTFSLSQDFQWQTTVPFLVKPFYASESYIDLLEQLQKGIHKTMRYHDISTTDLYTIMKSIDVPKEEPKLY